MKKALSLEFDMKSEIMLAPLNTNNDRKNDG